MLVATFSEAPSSLTIPTADGGGMPDPLENLILI